jgi:multicomponent K+:H+ antiporter subunit A
MHLALIAVVPFLGALLAALTIRAGRNVCAVVTGSFTAFALLGVLLHLPAVMRGDVIYARFDWLPGLGLNANLFLDGLGMLFAMLILGIGLLIVIYARFYLHNSDPMGQFFAYLMLFQGAMVGIVLSDNILLLLIFWELTSLSSFLLIGYWKHLPEGRQGARMALTVTGAGGLAMIAGMLILGNIVGSYDLSVILQHKDKIQASELYFTALILILAGAFTKSAQFPFHFWLPHAMAAPTPVSAYLHSATMVKAGLFLMARMWPVLAGTPEWFYIVATTGLVTMIAAAVIAVFKDDLKSLLAYSTVSHLGLITMLLGLGTKAAAMVAVFHIINHATFKAALFMSAGIVDHETHTRDIKRLGGLRHLMPITFTIVGVAGLSMAGIPPFNGFLSKELMLEEVVRTTWYGNPWIMAAFAALGAIFSVAYSFRLIAHTFLGPKRTDYPAKPHDPGIGLWGPPAFLAVLVVLIGLFPMTMVGSFVAVVASAVTGGEFKVKITHWHGFTAPLFLSILAVVGGLIILFTHKRLDAMWLAAPRPEAKRIFDASDASIAAWSRAFTYGLHNGALSRYFAIFIVAVVLAGVWAFLQGGHAPGLRAPLPIPLVVGVGFVLMVFCSLYLVFIHHQRLLALVLIGVIGLMVSLGFVYLSAPDLAMTQLTVEVVTIILLLLALNFLPKQTPRESSTGRKVRDLVLAGVAGVAVAALSAAMMLRDFGLPSISDYHVANSKIGGGGTNIVNVILVDFRAFDTFGEIIVLGIAAMVIYALTESLFAGRANRRLLSWTPEHKRAGDRHPMMLVVAARLALPIALMIGVFIFLRGHNEPGGGFIAGLVVAIALLMQYMASGFGWAHARKRIEYHSLIGWGIVIAGATGIGSWLAGRPFLTSNFGYFQIPPMEKFELATAMAFDLGVFLTVVGSVLLTLYSLSRMAVRAGQTVNMQPMDTNPSQDPAAKAGI